MKIQEKKKRKKEEADQDVTQRHSSKQQDFGAHFQVHDIVRPLSLASPNNGALAINGESAGLLPLAPQHAPDALVLLVVILVECAGVRGGGGRFLGGHEPAALEVVGDFVAEPALLVAPAGHLGLGVQQIPDARDAEAPEGVEGAVLVVDDLDVPGAAEEVDPASRGLAGGMGDGDAADLIGVAVAYGAEVEERFLGDCTGSVSFGAFPYASRRR